MSLCLNIPNSFANSPGILSGTDTLTGNNKPTFKIYDRFGKEYSFEDIKKMNTSNLRTVNSSCLAGFFKLDFTDEVGKGFNADMIEPDGKTNGQHRREVACHVFEDLSELITPTLNPSTGLKPSINIEVKPGDIPDSGLAAGTLGAASSYYLWDITKTGFIDGEIWKTINGGIDSYSNLNLTGYTGENFYHGILQINFINFTDWLTDLSDLTASTATNYHDLYSVILHESIHALGFTSLINGTGGSGLAGNVYSRFDTYLSTNEGISLITNNDNCYDTQFNINLSVTDLNNHCNVQYSGSTIQPIYSSGSFEKGSSFNHFDNTCPVGSPNGIPYLMAPALGKDIIRRRPLQEEVNVLCDLGYTTTSTFGKDAALTTIYKADYTSCGGNRIAGRNDINYFGTNNRYKVIQGNPIAINDFLSNDEYRGNAPTKAICINKVSGEGYLSNITDNSFTYNSKPCEVGEVLIRYIPKGDNGEIGNVTYIYIFVDASPLPCDPNSCNLICGGDFESVNNQFCYPLNDFNLIIEGNATALFQNNLYFKCPIDLSETTLYVGCDGPAAIPGPNNLTPGQKYVGFGYRQGIFFKLIQNLVSGAKYKISYYARNKENSCQHIVNIYGSENKPCRPPQVLDLSTPATNCDGATTFAPILLSQRQINNDTQWDKFEEIITAPTGSQIGYIIVAPNNPLFYAAYVLLDDISITPMPIAGTNQSICLGKSVQIGGAALSCFTYSWSPSAGLSSATISNPVAKPTITTTYTVTATDKSSGNTFSSSVTLTVNPIPSASISSGGTNALCSGSSITLEASSNLVVTYLWSTGANTQSITVTNSGTYSVTVTSTGGCTKSASTTVNTSTTPPVASFTFNAYDNVEDNSVNFTNTTSNIAAGTNYLWDFMDGSTSTAKDPSHAFDYPGYYGVKLTTTNNCGTSTSNKLIYIIPYYSGNLPTNACLSQVVYNYVNLYIATPTTGGIWSSGGIIKIKGFLNIQAGGSLVVTNGTTVSFGPQGKVIVEPAILTEPTKPRGILTLDNAKFTGINFNTCGSNISMMWQGTEVGGIASSSKETDQGKIILRNGAVIEDAYNGVILGRPLLGRDNKSPNKFWFGLFLPNSGGGIIQTDNCTFNRCAAGIVYAPYPYDIRQYHSPIRRCNFFCKDDNNQNSTLKDPYFKETQNHNTDEYYNVTLKDHNPFLPVNGYNGTTPSGGITGYNTNGRSVFSIKAENIYGVSIYLCTFDNANTFIYGTQSQFWVMDTYPTQGTRGKNNFLNSNAGIYIDSYFSSLVGQLIFTNKFVNVDNGIFTQSNSCYIEDNSFNKTSYNNTGTGISMNYSSRFALMDNDFTNYKTGIYCIGSGTTISRIDYLKKGNIFSSCETPIVSGVGNDFLKIKCNYNDNTNNYVVNWQVSGLNADGSLGNFANQGVIGTNVCNPAGNRFKVILPIEKNQINATGTKVFTYYYHNSEITKVTKQNANSTFEPKVSDVAFPEDPNLACKMHICGREGRLQEIRELVDKVKLLKYEYGNIKNMLDKGRTAELLEAIAKYTPANKLKDELIASSPLTDAVLKALLNRGVPLPPQVFKEIIIPNSPVSWEIYPLLEKKFSTLPPSITEEIRFAQSRDLPYRTLTRIEGDIDAKETERQIILQDRVRYYFENDSIPEALVLLEEEDNKEVKQILVGKYLEMMDYTRATDKLASLPKETQEDLDINDYYSILIGLGKDGKTIYDMEEPQIDKVRVIATHCPTTAISLNAQVLLKRVMDEEFAPCQENAAARLESNSLAQKFLNEPSVQNNSNEGKKVILEQNYPNPGSDKIIISFKIPDDMNAELKIYNYNGMLLENHPATSEAGSFVLNSEKWKSGVYFYSLFANGENISGFKKLILIK